MEHYLGFTLAWGIGLIAGYCIRRFKIPRIVLILFYTLTFAFIFPHIPMDDDLDTDAVTTIVVFGFIMAFGLALRSVLFAIFRAKSRRTAQGDLAYPLRKLNPHAVLWLAIGFALVLALEDFSSREVMFIFSIHDIFVFVVLPTMYLSLILGETWCLIKTLKMSKDSRS